MKTVCVSESPQYTSDRPSMLWQQHYAMFRTRNTQKLIGGTETGACVYTAHEGHFITQERSPPKWQMCCRLIHRCCKRWQVASVQSFTWCCRTLWLCPSCQPTLWWHCSLESFLVLSCADFSIFVQSAHEHNFFPLLVAIRYQGCEGKYGRLRGPVLGFQQLSREFCSFGLF